MGSQLDRLITSGFTRFVKSPKIAELICILGLFVFMSISGCGTGPAVYDTAAIKDSNDPNVFKIFATGAAGVYSKDYLEGQWKKKADAIVRAKGYKGYKILEYSFNTRNVRYRIGTSSGSVVALGAVGKIQCY